MHNPTAGRGKHDKRELMAALANAGHHAIYQSTKKSDYKKALKKPADLVLAAGGDGTVGKVGCELIDSSIPLGVLPLGTANNLARSLGFIALPEEIITGLEAAERRAFDIGLARGPWGKRYFFESAGGGLLADYLRDAKGKDKKTKKLSKEQEMRRHVSLLRRMLHDCPARKWKIELEGEDISNDYILLGSDEHSLGRPHTLSRIAVRDQRWPLRFRMCPGRGLFPLHGIPRCPTGWAEGQIPAAAPKVSRVKNCLGKFDASLRRQSLDAQKEGQESEQHRNHG